MTAGVEARPFLFTCICPNPNCQVRNMVYDESHNCCFKCGERLFEARRGSPAATAKPVEESHFWRAMNKTFVFVMWVVGIGFGLYVLAWTWWIILGGALLLSPIFLFFYVRSRLSRRAVARNSSEH